MISLADHARVQQLTFWMRTNLTVTSKPNQPPREVNRNTVKLPL